MAPKATLSIYNCSRLGGTAVRFPEKLKCPTFEWKTDLADILYRPTTITYTSKTCSSIPSSWVLSSESPRSDLGWIGLMDVRELMKEFAKYTKCKFKDIYFWGFFLYSALGFYFYAWVGWGRSNGRQRARD